MTTSPAAAEKPPQQSPQQNSQINKPPQNQQQNKSPQTQGQQQNKPQQQQQNKPSPQQQPSNKPPVQQQTNKPTPQQQNNKPQQQPIPETPAQQKQPPIQNAPAKLPATQDKVDKAIIDHKGSNENVNQNQLPPKVRYLLFNTHHTTSLVILTYPLQAYCFDIQI